MNTEHNDINKFIPYGEALRGFADQKFISAAEIHRILKERGIFTFNNNKDYTVPIMQTLLLSPNEFDKVKDAFVQKEDSEKKISREIKFNNDAQLSTPELLSVELDDFIKKQLSTCSLKRPIRFSQVDGNPNHLKASFLLNRKDINKSWYEQTHQFSGSVEFINEKGKGTIIITHTAPETKDLAEQIVKEQVKRYKEKGIIPNDEQPKKILFSEFTNSTRFAFFYRLTTKLESDDFTCKNIKNISVKPQDNYTLPEQIQWMEKINKLLISGESLDKKFFMKEEIYYKALELWSIDAFFSYNYKGEKGEMTVSLGFPDFTSKQGNAEFEINIVTLKNKRSLNPKDRKKLKSSLLSEMDKQKSVVYNNFLIYLASINK